MVKRPQVRPKKPQSSSRRMSTHQIRLISHQLQRFKTTPPLGNLFLKQTLSPLSLLCQPQPAAPPHQLPNLSWCWSPKRLIQWTQTARVECTPFLMPTEVSGVTSAQDMEAFHAIPSTVTCQPKTSSPGLITPYPSSGTALPPLALATRQRRTERIFWTWKLTSRLPVIQLLEESTSLGQLPPWSSSGSPREPGKRMLH